MTIDRINLFKKGESVETELETAKVLNKCFSNIVNNACMLLSCHVSEFYENIFSKNQCGLTKNHRAQQCLLVMLEK